MIDQAGRPVEHQTFQNTPQGHRKAIAWLQRRNIARVGIEGSGSYGRPLAVRLAAQGVDTVEVPPQMTAQARRRQRTRRKTDHTDAPAIARVTAREDDLPAARCDEAVDDLRSLVLYRRELVEARTAEINRLHADLTRLRPGYHKLCSSGLAAPKALNRVSRLIAKCPTARAQVAKSRIKQIRQLLRQVSGLDAQITCYMDAIDTSLTGIYGIGTLTAAERSPPKRANPAGTPPKPSSPWPTEAAPVEASSGRVVRHRLNRGGNRRLNRALHYAAISQIARPGTEGRCFYEQLLKRGKTKQEAIRILKTAHLRPGLDPPPNHQHLT